MNNQMFRVGLVSFWTLLILALWGWWTMTSLRPDGDPISDAGRGMIVILTSGCCGGFWLIGLLAFFLIFAIIRR